MGGVQIMKIGFIGLNHQGESLIKSFLQAQTFLPTEIIVYDLNKDKADFITSSHPGIFAAQHSRELIQEATCFFLTSDENEYKTIKKEIQSETKPSHVLISLINSISVEELETDLPCKIAKIHANSDCSQIYSFSTGSRMNQVERNWLKQLFSTITYSRKSATL